MELNKLIIKVYSNFKKDTEIIYCFSHHESNIKCICNKVINLNSKVYILGNPTSVSGINNFESNKEIYKQNNITVDSIPCPNLPIINTKIESDLIIDWAIKYNLKEIGICSPPYHLLRAYMTLVSSSIKKNYNINIFPFSGITDDWNKKVVCHQGKNTESFNEMIDLELVRINNYTKKGDILEVKYILEYMDKRNI